MVVWARGRNTPEPIVVTVAAAIAAVPGSVWDQRQAASDGGGDGGSH